MHFRSVGGGIKLIHSTYSEYGSAKPILASEHLVKETLGIETDEEIILIDDENVKYYSVLGGSGLGSFKSSAAHSLLYILGGPLGALASTTMDVAAGGKNKRLVVFVKINDNSRVLLLVEDGYQHLLRCKEKIDKDDINDSDLRWIRKSLEEHPVYL